MYLQPPNKPLEWTGLQQLTAFAPQSPCLPLRGSVRRISIRLKLFDVLGCEILTCDAESILRA